MNRSILLIDDDKHVLSGLYRLLHAEGHEVETANGYDEGKSALLNQDFEVVISDFDLAGKNGIDLLDYSKEKNPRGARILISAEVDRTPYFLSEGRKKGFKLVLKPWNDDYLLATLQEALASSMK
jgi:DNA-binding NtrC family response regulator